MRCSLCLAERVTCETTPCGADVARRETEIDVYDRRLEAISAAAELGSFSRAAAKLRVSTPALVKQVSGFEAEFGITLFERSHSGVKVTPAGALLVDDARSIMRQSEDALRRARRAAGDGGAVRLGVSMMCRGAKRCRCGRAFTIWNRRCDLRSCR